MDHFAGLDVSVKEMDSLKALDPDRPIREADIVWRVFTGSNSLAAVADHVVKQLKEAVTCGNYPRKPNPRMECPTANF